jgi:hypothetical protein
MTTDELRQLYTEAVKIIRAQRIMVQSVFRHNETRRAEKLAELDRLEQVLTQFKDELKPYLAEPEQPKLFDVPRKDAYQ